jgi:glycine betaine transporter
LLVVLITAFFRFSQHFIQNQGHRELAKVITSDVTLAVFRFFDYLTLSSLLNYIGFAVILIYYITVADTSTYALGMICEGGKIIPSTKIKLIWGVIQSAIAVVLLLAGGSDVLQNASIIAAFPFAIIMLVMCWSLIKGLREDTSLSVKEESLEGLFHENPHFRSSKDAQNF